VVKKRWKEIRFTLLFLKVFLPPVQSAAQFLMVAYICDPATITPVRIASSIPANI